MNNSEESSSKKAAKLLLSIIFLTFATACILAIATYNPEDPSYNNFTDNEPTNFFGEFGSHTADLFVQIFGLGSYFLLIIPMTWCLQKITNYKSYSFFVRFISYLLASTCFLSIIAPYSYSETQLITSGGALGMQIYVWLSNQEIPYTLTIQIISLIIFLYFALGFRHREWINSFKRIYFHSAHLIKTISLKIISSCRSAYSLRKKILQSNKNPHNPIESPYNEIISETSAHTGPSFKTSDVKAKKEKPISYPSVKNTSNFKLPTPDLLNKLSGASKHNKLSSKVLDEKADELTEVLKDFGVIGKVIGVYPGPVVTLFEFEPSAGTKSSRVIGLSDDIARTMRANSARISVIPGKNSMGIELPNNEREMVYLREIIEDNNYSQSNKKLPMILGKDISGSSIVSDLASMPHLLVAGTTGSGKSVAINTMILSLLYKHTPETCKFIMIDPKMLELSIYDGIPHLLAPVVTEPSKAVTSLKWVVREMENRYRKMSHVNVRNVEGFNQKIADAIKNNTTLERKVQSGFDPETGKPIYDSIEIEKQPLPFIVVIVDEMADLMIVAGKEIEGSIQRLAQMARAAGIHIIMATQRPSVDVITGVIKANFPTRISFHVTSKVDSRTILGEMGAEQLLGKGDMLYMSGGSRIKRVHGPFVDDSEVERVVTFLKNQSQPDYSVDITEESCIDAGGQPQGSSSEDDLYNQAVELVCRENKASTSYLQRYFKIGYNRAANLIEEMERNGIVSSANHVGKREILKKDDSEA